MSDQYILDGDDHPVPEPNLKAWARWFENADNRRVDNTQVGDSRVSTVFLAVDHGFGRHDPILWETMVFGGPMAGEMDRCSGLRDDALLMHQRMVDRVRKLEKK